MRVRFTIPNQIYLHATAEADLPVSTSFPFRNLSATIGLRPSGTITFPDEHGTPAFYSAAPGIDILIEEPHGVTFLSALVRAQTVDALVDLLVKIANRAILSIRNFGRVTHLREIRDDAEDPEALLARWTVEFNEAGSEWQPVRRADPVSAFAGLMSAGLSGPFRELNVAHWPDIAEAMAESLDPAPEEEFSTNCLEHLQERNFRLALLEAIICLEIVVSQFLRSYFTIERGVSKGKIERILGSGLDLYRRVAAILPLVLEKDLLDRLDIDLVLTAIRWRNEIIHVTGRLPGGLDETALRRHIAAVLYLALRLGKKRDDISAQPDLRQLAAALATEFGIDAPTLQQLS